MKIDFNIKSLDDLLNVMGARLIEAKESSDFLSPLEIEELQSQEGKQINIDDVAPDDDGLIRYFDEIVMIHIRDTQKSIFTVENHPEDTVRFHVAYHCTTLMKMREKGKIDRYFASQNMDGEFTVDAYVDERNRNSEIKETISKLKVCKNCLKELQYKGCTTERPVPVDIWHGFDIPDFFENYPKAHFKKPKFDKHTYKGSDYTSDFPIIRRELLEKRNYCCERCKVNLSQMNLRKLLHVHHKNSVKSDNSLKNLEVLCIDCHANEHAHLVYPERMKNLREECIKIKKAQGIIS